MTADGQELRKTIIREIERTVDVHPGNRDEEGTPYFDAPLVGFAALDDPLFREYKRIIGTFHWTPAQVLDLLPGREPGVRGGTVISWVLPVSEATRISNRKEDRFPSRRWSRTRHFGEEFNDALRRTVVDLLSSRGVAAAAPMLLAQWRRVDDPVVGWASRWSERHAAYAAGLGTFSINDGLITAAGIAHRVGSVVTDTVLEPSPRPYEDYRGYCLTAAGLSCGACIRRCPVQSITEEGHDKAVCRNYTYGPAFVEIGRKHGATEVGCGLCQTDVPCEDRIPDREPGAAARDRE